MASLGHNELKKGGSHYRQPKQNMTHRLQTFGIQVNSLVPGKPGCNFKNANFNLVLLNGIFRLSYKNTLKEMPRDPPDDKSTYYIGSGNGFVPSHFKRFICAWHCLPCKPVFSNSSPPNFPKFIAQLWEIPEPQCFMTLLFDPFQT